MSSFLLAIDQGTTGSTVLLMGVDGQTLGRGAAEFPQHFPEPGWVEHDLDEIWESVLTATRRAFETSGLSPADCLAIGITNQRETTVVWDRKTGEAIHRAIVWQDRRTAPACDALKAAGHETLFRERTGLVLDPYFSGTKVAWILDNIEGARARAERGELAFGTIDSWLVWRLSGGAAHVTDETNASRTLLYNICDHRFDEELAGLLSVPMSMLPEVKSCAEIYAKTTDLEVIPAGIPIAGMAGDQQAALFGQTCFSPGDAKCTYGTGAFLLMNIGDEFVESKLGLLTTVAWRLGDKTTYALEGSAFIAGAAVQWLRDSLGVITSAEEIEARASEVEDSGGVVFVPALTGLGAPHWDAGARGLISGITRGTTTAHLCRATLEGIALQIVDLTGAMASDAGRPIERLRVDGGASKNNLLMQFQSDVCQLPIERPQNVETTALGAAYLAGLGAGVFDGFESIIETHAVDTRFEVRMTSEERTAHLDRWNTAIARTRLTHD